MKTETVISIKNLYKAFGQQKILNGIDLNLNKKENDVKSKIYQDCRATDL